MSSTKKVLVVGLDGATLDLLEPWIDQGKLPHLGRFKREGVYGHLESVFPPVTPSAWASFMTGRNPAKHGIVDFGVRQEESYERKIAMSHYIKCRAFWDYLGDAGVRVGVLRVPIVYPPSKVNGFLITGIFSPSWEAESYPPELIEEVKEKIADYRSSMKVYKFIEGMEDAYLADLLYTTEKHAEEALYLLDTKDWDFFMATLFYGDWIQHFFWKHMDSSHPLHDPSKAEKYGDAILKYYEKVDEIIGRFLERIGEDVDVLIISDHGAGPVFKDVYINNWLRDLGLLCYKEEKKRRMFYILSKLGIHQKNIDKFFSKLKLVNLIKLIPKFLVRKFYWSVPTGRPALSDIDWAKTKAYSLGYFGQIFINLHGREPEGIVQPGEEYEALRDEIIEKLKELRDPETGERLVDRIYKKEEVYSGPYIDQAADIVFEMKGLTYMTRNTYEGTWDERLVGPPGNGESATHRTNGLFMAMGPSFKRGVKIEGARIYDIAPTLLHLFKVPIPQDMDGKVLISALRGKQEIKIKKGKEEEPAKKRVRLSKEDEEKIKESLRRLGYL
jgi:predicted AlkP superfamily phosphohydrolase/phosphomutase